MKTQSLTIILTFLILTAFSASCKSELDNKAKAKVNEPAKEVSKEATSKKVTPEKKETPNGMMSYEIDTKNSIVAFVGAKAVGDHPGKFREFRGEASVKGEEIAGLSFEVNTTSVDMEKGKLDDTYHKKLTNHMLSPDFFDAEKFPKASFTATSFKASKTENATHLVTGDLTIRGVKKSISFPAKIKITPEGITADTEFKINRGDFGVTYKGMADNLIKEEVLLKITLKTLPKK